MDYYQTALRDPVFYKLQKRLVDFVILFKKKLPCYTKEDLMFPGVKVDNVVVDKLVTYFDDYLMDMTNAVVMNDVELKKTTSDMKFFVRKRRLNHQPFKVTIDITSDKSVDCIVRLFLGPKKDYLGRLIDINQNRLNFVELDSFVHKLDNGKNRIVRDSIDMHNMVRDRIMTRDFWKKLDGVTDMRGMFMKELRNYHTGFPIRLLLPRGHVEGMDFMLYVICTPVRHVDNIDVNVMDDKHKDLIMDFRHTVLLDKMPLGFPFDRHIDVDRFFTTNMKFVDVKIFHKGLQCDMKMRWERWVMKNYHMVDMNRVDSDTYFTDVDIDKDIDRDHAFDF